MERSSRQQVHIDAEPEAIWELVGDPNRHPDWWPEMHRGGVRRPAPRAAATAGSSRVRFGLSEHELTIERLDGCREVSIFCDGTGVTTRFVLTDAQGGTFVEGYFAIEPNSIGTTVIAAAVGRRYLRSWLEHSLANLKTAAERAPAAP